ncbi:transposase [Cetobacterium sp.]|uniref:transposase n=1 Tax=Cetobacterium sp. TaxID=2071632 RepID=UPI003EE6C82B
MSKKNKTYTEEFKKTLVDFINNGKTMAEVSREYGVATSNLVGWKKLYSNISQDSEELITLIEYKKLKKALTIFAKN